MLRVRDIDVDGTCSWDRLHATGYRVAIWGAFRKDQLGEGRVRVSVEGTGTLTIKLADAGQ